MGNRSARSEDGDLYVMGQKELFCCRSSRWKRKQQVLTPVAGGPFRITFDDGSMTVLENILVGEIWICSGQSNMAMPMKGKNKSQPTLNSEKVIAASGNDQIRLFTVKQSISSAPKDDCEGIWAAATPQTTPDFSAIGFQSGQFLQKQLNVPVGLINTSWGGTSISLWMSDSFEQFAKLYPADNFAGKANAKKPKSLYNAMIAPLSKLTISGFIWYQGEADKAVSSLYLKMLPAMVKEWPANWRQGDLPFYYAQIAPYTYGGNIKMARMGASQREAQLEALNDISNAAMVVTADVGSAETIHPPDKTTVADRFARAALGQTYRMKIAYKGPEVSGMKVSGSKAVIKLNNTGNSLVLKKGDPANFEVAGEDKVLYPATVKVDGSKLWLSSSSVAKPVAVRYGFKNYFMGNLFNADGLPASPFWTDHW